MIYYSVTPPPPPRVSGSAPDILWNLQVKDTLRPHYWNSGVKILSNNYGTWE